MKIILSQDVDNLGDEGDVLQATDGYARNYLFPLKFAVRFSDHNQHILEQRRVTLDTRKEDKRTAAMGLKERIEADELLLSVPAGESGKLFGSVNNAMIAEELEKKGIEVDRRRIAIPEHTIRELGEHMVRIRLYEQEEAQLKVIVEKAEQA